MTSGSSRHHRRHRHRRHRHHSIGCYSYHNPSQTRLFHGNHTGRENDPNHDHYHDTSLDQKDCSYYSSFIIKTNLPFTYQKLNVFNELIEKGRAQKGKLSTADIDYAIVGVDYLMDELDRLYDDLDGNGIEIVDDLSDDILNLLNFDVFN